MPIAQASRDTEKSSIRLKSKSFIQQFISFPNLIRNKS